jgi:O-antigen ligase
MQDTFNTRLAVVASIATLAACCALAYGVIAFDVKAIAALGILLAIIACISWPFVGLLALVGTVPIEALVTGDGSIPLLKGLAAVVAVAWGGRFLMKRRHWPPRLPVGCNGATLLLLFLAAASAMWAIYPMDALSGAFSLVQLVLLGVIVADMAVNWKRLDHLLSFFVLGGLIAAVATIADFYVFGAKRAGDGVSGGINGTAAVLVSILPFAPYVATRAAGLWARGVGSAYILLAPVAIMVTFSRSGWLMLLALGGFFGVKWIKHKGMGQKIVVCAALIVLAVIAPKDAIVERASSIREIVATSQDGTSGVADSRGYHYEVGREMLSDAPLWGMGYNNYPRAFRFIYQFRVPGSEKFYSSLRSPHSSYIGIAAELGALGVLCWMSVMAMQAAILVRARKYLRATPGMRSGISLPNAALAALLMQVGFCVTTTVHLTKTFWIVTGLIGAIGFLSRGSYLSWRLSESADSPYRVAPEPVESV